MNKQSIHEGKSIAIISYFWWIGLIIAFIMNNSKKNSFAAFHIRQMLGLLLLSLANGIIYNYVDNKIGYLLGVGIFVLWIIGFMGAFNGQEKKIPLLGDQFQEWFRGIN
jgi:uncharacterized membrane protein